ncbi:MAG: squalene/phytoene synthase family protein [Acidobacteria bacterium]|nr:squalene/phytoene synthase family protein [Acidobacteriota bacterium]
MFDYRDTHLHLLSDHICTALQLANFWQDVAVDIQKDRIYLPQDDLARYGVTVEDLKNRRLTSQYASLLKFQVRRTKEIFEQGRVLPSLVGGRLAIELRLTWLGGMRILEKIEGLQFDTLTQRPSISTSDKIMLLLKSLISRK